MKAAVPAVNNSRWILWIYAGGFLLGAAKHGYEILRGGFLPYTNAPFAFNLYWTSLLALDLLVVVLIPLRPRWAALLAVVMMISDMVVDLYVAGVFLAPKHPDEYWPPRDTRVWPVCAYYRTSGLETTSRSAREARLTVVFVPDNGLICLYLAE